MMYYKSRRNIVLLSNVLLILLPSNGNCPIPIPVELFPFPFRSNSDSLSRGSHGNSRLSLMCRPKHVSYKNSIIVAHHSCSAHCTETIVNRVLIIYFLIRARLYITSSNFRPPPSLRHHALTPLPSLITSSSIKFASGCKAR
jgi:hypothetical protein